MEAHGQTFSPEILARIQAEVDNHPSISRRELSRRVCEWLDWRGANGKAKAMSCRVALLDLHRRGVIELPPVMSVPGFENPCPAHRQVEVDEPPQVECSLKELGGIEFKLIKSWDKKSSRIWNTLMERYHYLGGGPLCGAQIRYLIHSESYGWLGGVSFSAAAWHLEARDRWIGWEEAARRNNLQKIVCNSRFLILPQVKVPNLASYILSRCVVHVRQDWPARYAISPVLMETFVERGRFKGTCYRAANWIYLGTTKGRGRGDRYRKNREAIKDIYLYPLQEDARDVLCDGPPRAVNWPFEAQDWAEEEFGRAELLDARRNRRLLSVARDFYARHQACGSRAKTKAAYRFLRIRNIAWIKYWLPTTGPP